MNDILIGNKDSNILKFTSYSNKFEIDLDTVDYINFNVIGNHSCNIVEVPSEIVINFKFYGSLNLSINKEELIKVREQIIKYYQNKGGN